MKLKDNNGGMINVTLTNKVFNGESKSLFQQSVGKQLTQQYPFDIIYQEVWIKSERFYLDFFIPNLKLVVECHGKQHVEHIKFFHKTKSDFNKQQSLDQRKRQWCKINNFKLVEIYDR